MLFHDQIRRLKMKKFSIFLLIVVILASCTGGKDSYTINGTINGVDSGMVFLQKFDVDQWVKIDSTQLVKGEFTFKGKTLLPEMWYLSMKEKQVFVPLFIENSKINLEIFADSVDKVNISGSVSHDIYKQYQAMNKSLNDKIEEIYKEWKKAKESKDSAAMKMTDSISTELDKQMKQNLIDFVKANNKTAVASYLIIRNAWQFDLPELESMVNTLDTSLNSSIYTQSLKNRVTLLKSVDIGQPAPDFTLSDTTGNPFGLSDIKGGYLLVDFWASWCSPCRAENPNIVKVFKAYNNKGFNILGVSFDTNRDKWIQAIKDDNLTWHHVSDLKGWGNAAGKLYGIMSIPANVLLDPDRKIIAHNLKGEELMKRLEELLGQAIAQKKVKGKPAK